MDNQELYPQDADSLLFAAIPDVPTADVLAFLSKRFEIERISRYFSTAPYTFEGREVTITPLNSILMEFPRQPSVRGTVPGDAHQSPSASPAHQKTVTSDVTPNDSTRPYRLLFLLGLRSEADFGHEVVRELKHAQGAGNIDHVVIWTHERPAAAAVDLLRSHAIDVIHITHEDISKLQFISHFRRSSHQNYVHAVTLNAVVDLLLRRLKKLFHVVLSDIAASAYDVHYGKDKVGTFAAMEFETSILEREIARLKKKGRTNIAVDIGCGTGRHTFALARTFHATYGFDFSREMIKVADAAKLRLDKSIHTVHLNVTDFEYDELIDEREFAGQTDIVVASFGMASFVEDTVRMIRKIYDWLTDGGVALLSFYNSQSLLLQVTPNWRDTSLSAQLDTDTETLKVELSPGSIFHIYCKPFSDAARSVIADLLQINAVYTYPTVMALLPNSLLRDRIAFTLFQSIDSELSRSDIQMGHYVTVVARKAVGRVAIGPAAHARVLESLGASGVAFEVLNHEPVYSLSDVVRELGIRETNDAVLVKTVIFRDRRRTQQGSFIAVAVRSDQRVDKHLLSELLGIPNSKLVFAAESEIERIGFPPGAVTPFAFTDPSVTVVVDESIMGLREDVSVYIGAGDNRKSLMIKAAGLRKLLQSAHILRR